MITSNCGSIRNTTDQPVKARQMWVTFRNPFGEMLFATDLTYGQSTISPHDIVAACFSWKDNPYISGQPYDMLVAFRGILSIRVDSVHVVK